tara:strand:- start:870 stop:1151 length:282 start_codon:yes stop_codon:yes gene_type:complete
MEDSRCERPLVEIPDVYFNKFIDSLKLLLNDNIELTNNGQYVFDDGSFIISLDLGSSFVYGCNINDKVLIFNVESNKINEYYNIINKTNEKEK